MNIGGKNKWYEREIQTEKDIEFFLFELMLLYICNLFLIKKKKIKYMNVYTYAYAYM